MGNAKCIGRVGALAVALGVGNVRHSVARTTVAVVVAAVVVAVLPSRESSVSPAVRLSAESTALIVCGTTCPTADDALIEIIMNQYITPTHPGQTITPVAVTTPQEYGPITGLFRLVGLALGDPRVFGPGGPAWPDEPWWKLSGLFDLTINQSIQAGAIDLERAMAEHGNDHLVIYGNSQGATVANTVKRRLAEQYPAGTAAPDIDFVLHSDPNHPNGGLSSRFPGLYIPFLDLTFDGPAPTDTQFDTVEINRQYDGASDFPLYPLNVIASANALLGFVYLHTNAWDVSLPEDPTTSPAFQGTHGDTSYYFFETENLPLFAPLRSLGVPESLIDVVEPFFRVLVELGYDRSISPWEPTPARLIPSLDPAAVITDLVSAIGEGVTNAFSPVGSPATLSTPAPVALAAPHTETATVDSSRLVTSKDTTDQAAQAMSTDTETSSRTTVTETDPPTSAHTDTDTDTSTSSHATETTKTASTAASAVESSETPTHKPSASVSTPKPAKPADAGSTTSPSSSAASSSTDSSSSGESGGDGDGS